MKRLSIIFTFFLIVSMVCYAQSPLGKKVEKGGLSCREITHAVDDEESNTNSVKLHDTVKIKFEDIEGFVVRDDRIYPGISIELLSPEGQRVLYTENAMENFSESGMNKIFAKGITATIGTGEPMTEGKTYKVNLRLFDAKGKGEIEYTTDIVITGVNKQEPITSGDIVSSGLTIERALLAQNNQEIVNDSYKVGDTVQFFLMNVEGLEQGSDGLYHFDMDVSVKDSSGNVVFEQKELLKEAGHLKLQDGKLKSPMVSIETASYPAGKYFAVVTIYDQNSDKSATAEKTFGLFNIK